MLEVDERVVCRGSSIRLDARAAGARQPQPRPARPLRRGARGRRRLAHGRREPSRPRTSSPTHPTPTWCGPRCRRKVTWVALGLGWRSDAATCPSCGALLEWSADRFDCPTTAVRLRAARRGEPARRRRRSSSTARASRSRSRCPALEPSRTPRSAVTAAAHFGVDPHASPQRSLGDGHERRRPLHDGAARRRAVGARAARQEPRRLDRGAATRSADARHVGRDRGQRTRRRRQGPVVALGRARTSCCAATPSPPSGERHLDVAVRLRYARGRARRRARPARGGAPRSPATTCTSSRRTRSSPRCTEEYGKERSA